VRVLSEAVASAETKILEQNVQSGTATRSGVNCPTAAKTGTTSELVDAWLDGYTPNYSTAVWMGYPNKRVSMTSVHGQPQQGGYLPAEIWHAYMSSVLEGKTCEQFPSASQSLSYQPFFGKFATTGQSESGQSGSGNSERTTSKPHRSGTGSQGNREGARREGGGKHGNGGGAPAAPEESEAPGPRAKAPSGPAQPAPGGGHTVKGTGGAGPG
jgi:penicillin-binding protein 1A